ncbi:DUF4439 domain-containing protein [Cellulomonas composti]|uniref:DUF4439 domain-containing protein n=1 Tax=Cellulomonas composti TaxID=266130 RepID=A0A511J8K0_9CELL|nr:DUF4439 domain-containing protein [Cellulomonas composti]GEL94331.1 hypothetical protein CCO02nite_09890 [Cellulomonas composti]
MATSTAGRTTNGPTSTRAHRAPARGVLVVVLAALVATLTGCGLRLETPPPPEPSPDALEQVRARGVDDALTLVDVANRALGTSAMGSDAPSPTTSPTTSEATPDAVDPVSAVLTDVVTFSTAHADQLGGEYVSGLATPAASPGEPATPAPATAQDVLDLLADTSATARTDTDAVTDGPLARLLGSVATARAQLMTRLAAAADLPVPEQPADPAAPSATPTATPTGVSSDPTTDPTTDPATDPGADPGAEPTSDSELPVDAIGDLVLTHDQAGYAFEVIAAHRADAAQDLAFAQAQRHRAAAQSWAVAAGIDGTEQDPRLAAYALPAGIDDPDVGQALARSSEQAIAAAYANAVGAAPAGTRTPYLDGLRDAIAAAGAWGAAPVAFPGLPEQASAATDG